MKKKYITPFVKEKDGVSMNHYVLNFWASIMKPEAFTVYYVLIIRSNFEKKSFPSIEDISDFTLLSKASIKLILERLWRLEFINIVDVHNETTGDYVKSWYIPKKSIPVLGDEQYDNLSDVLKREHDAFLNNCL